MRAGDRLRAPREQTKPARLPPKDRTRFKTLAILLDSMVGEKMRVELKNNIEVLGTLDEVTRDMGLTMSQAWCERPDVRWAG